MNYCTTSAPNQGLQYISAARREVARIHRGEVSFGEFACPCVHNIIHCIVHPPLLSDLVLSDLFHETQANVSHGCFLCNAGRQLCHAI